MLREKLGTINKGRNKMGMQGERIKKFSRPMFITHSKPSTH